MATDLSSDKENLTYESIEWESNVDECSECDTIHWNVKPLVFHAAEDATLPAGQSCSNINICLTERRARRDARLLWTWTEHVGFFLEKIDKKL